ncbi:hypothetical protein A3E35_03200 [Candidatus Giovannonibacteria bacterium RIFCSPHIGHO2_12_FULL_44_22]|nr:MAG: hypothetical protein A3E35_03200 [Candidatus Giovannonibacteria bacterium RIFCSPHIGHO2_12_FULL_44_22]
MVASCVILINERRTAVDKETEKIFYGALQQVVSRRWDEIMRKRRVLAEGVCAAIQRMREEKEKQPK